jgi:hypothetical protein
MRANHTKEVAMPTVHNETDHVTVSLPHRLAQDIDALRTTLKNNQRIRMLSRLL